ncbi:MAG TPA: hypothetical protein VI756_32740 [Blastocatellia bacterium]
MLKRKFSLVFAIALVLGPGLISGFSRTGANIKGVKLGKAKGVAEEVDTFGAEDTIWVLTGVAEVAGPVNIKARLVVEDVPGQQNGPVPGLEATLNTSQEARADFHFSPPNNGWPKGKYSIEVLLLGEDGSLIDKKAAEFSVE